MALGSWRGTGRPLGDPLEALEELLSDFGRLGGFWGQSCQTRHDDKTLLSIVFLITHVFLLCFVTNLYKVIAPENVKNP